MQALVELMKSGANLAIVTVSWAVTTTALIVAILFILWLITRPFSKKDGN